VKPHILWEGATNNKGYGHRWVKGVYWLVHRYAFKQANGRIPKGKQVRHLCGVKLCIEPTHLAVGTQSDNEKDKVKHGTARYYFQYAKRAPGKGPGNVLPEER
jgi:hypothetical protein